MLALRRQQELDQRLEVVLQSGLAERDVGQLEEVVLEVVQVPQDRLAVERIPGIGDGVVHHPTAPDLEPWQPADHVAVYGHHRVGKGAASLCPGLVQGIEERRVSQVFEEVDTALFIVRDDLRNRKVDAAEGSRKRQECPILFVVRPHHADDRFVPGAQQSPIGAIGPVPGQREHR